MNRPRKTHILNGVLWLISLVLYICAHLFPISESYISVVGLLRSLGGDWAQAQTDDQLMIVAQRVATELSIEAGRLVNFSQIEEPTYDTISSGIISLLDSEENLLALTIFLFVVIVPILKLILTFPFDKFHLNARVKFAERIHRYAMVDVFVVSIIVFSLFERAVLVVEPQVGTTFFIAYFFASLIQIWISRTSLDMPLGGRNSGISN